MPRTSAIAFPPARHVRSVGVQHARCHQPEPRCHHSNEGLGGLGMLVSEDRCVCINVCTGREGVDARRTERVHGGASMRNYACARGQVRSLTQVWLLRAAAPSNEAGDVCSGTFHGGTPALGPPATSQAMQHTVYMLDYSTLGEDLLLGVRGRISSGRPHMVGSIGHTTDRSAPFLETALSFGPLSSASFQSRWGIIGLVASISEGLVRSWAS